MRLWMTLVTTRLLAMGTGVLGAGPTNADLPDLLTNPVEVTNVSASAGEKGGVSRLRFTVTNTGMGSLTLVGVRSGVSERAKIVGRTSTSAAVVLQGLGIPADDTADGNTSHLWVELCPLKHPLVAGDVFTVTMVFSRGEVDLDVHVHPDRHATPLPC